MSKRHTTPVAPRHGSSNASPETEATQLRHELHEALEQQAATAGVLKLIISSSFGDPQQVFANILASAIRICGADGGALHLAATHNMPQAFMSLPPTNQSELASKIALEPGRGTVLGRATIEAKPVQVADVLADPEYTLHEAQREIGYRTVLGVPLLRDGHSIGVISLMRLAVHPFTDKQIEIVQNFADQAVVAVENTRLIAELHQRTDQLARSVTELQRERNNKLMNLEAMVASISHEVRQPLASIVTHGHAALRFLKRIPSSVDETQSSLESIISDSHRASQVFDNIRILFGKGDAGHEPIGVNALVQRALSAVQRDLDNHAIATSVRLSDNLPKVLGHKGQLEEVLLNLVRNAVEAMQTDKNDLRVLQVGSGRSGDKIVVTVEDSGPGIDPKQAEKIFDAFVTTKSHGMGLGLALCRMIIERHSGELSALPAHPRGSIFRVALPILPSDEVIE